MKKTKKTSITDNISAKSDANRIVKNMVMYIYTQIKVLIFICHSGFFHASISGHNPVLSSSWLITRFIARVTWQVPLVEQELLTLTEHMHSPQVFSGVRFNQSLVFYVMFFYRSLFVLLSFFMPPRRRVGGGILIYPLSVRLSVHPFVHPFIRPSGYRYMVCPAISSYSFGATALIFCRMFIHIMEVCMSTGFWWSDTLHFF